MQVHAPFLHALLAIPLVRGRDAAVQGRAVCSLDGRWAGDLNKKQLTNTIFN